MRRNEGFLLVTVLFVSVVVGLLVLATSFTALVDRRIASSQRVGTEAFYVAQAGMERLKLGLYRTLADGFAAGGVNACGFPGTSEIDLGGGVVLPVTTGSDDVTREISLTAGEASLSYRVDRNYFIMRSVGVVGPARSTVEVVATAGVGVQGVWDNAIFAQTFGTTLQAGNSAVYGSMHIIAGEAQLEVADFTGTAGVYNNYYGINGQPPSDVSDTATGSLGLDRTVNQTDLCALLKIASGTVNFGNNSNLGTPDYSVGTRTYEGSVQGVYLLGEAESLTIQNEPYDVDATYSSVFVRNGVSDYAGFGDDAVTFPDNITPSSALDVTPTSCPWLFFEGSLQLPPRVSVSKLLTTQPEPCSSVGSDGKGNSISWDPVSQVLTVEGIILTSSDIVIGEKDALRYSGMGTLRTSSSTATITIKNEVRAAGPSEDYLLGTGLGIVGRGGVVVDTSRTLDALLYSSETIDIRGNPDIVGALVGLNVTTGNNNPSVIYHPDVAKAAQALRLPGSDEPGNVGYLVDVSSARR